MDSKSSSGGYTTNYTRNPKGTVPIWVDGCCIMKSVIAESGRNGNPTTIKVLSREPGNTGWSVYTCVSIEPYMEDLDNNQFQPNQPHDVTDDTVAQIGAENRANHGSDDIVHIINNREWTEEQKRKLVEIDTQERRRGKNFMKRMKARWDMEYPASRRTAQNLIDNARRLKKKGWGRPAELEDRDETEVQQQTQVIREQQRKSIKWTTEMKIVFAMLDEEKRAKDKRFMKRVKDRWNRKYPEYESASW